ncbi:hypothetical protein D3C80_2132780 [compost metagenome]
MKIAKKEEAMIVLTAKTVSKEATEGKEANVLREQTAITQTEPVSLLVLENAMD